MQSLPNHTASEAVYLLSGTLPIKADLDTRQLILCGTIARLPEDNPLKKVATRQMAIKPKHSWYSQLTSIAKDYVLDLAGTATAIFSVQRCMEMSHHSGNLVGLADETSGRNQDQIIHEVPEPVGPMP